MGSYALSTSNTSAIDKRQVTSENATGQSVDGNGNLTNAGMYQTLTNSSINSLDGGAIKGAFDFAKQSLSSVLELAINKDKVAAFSAAPTGLANAEQVAAVAQSSSAQVDTAKKIGFVVVALAVGALWFVARKGNK